MDGKISACYTAPRSKGLETFDRRRLNMKKFFDDGVLVMSVGIFACALAVGLAIVYAFDKFI